jgi:regulator of sigma E protease
VKIPGMHRPAPGDLRRSLPPAEVNRLREHLDRLDAALERGDEETARRRLDELAPHLPRSRALQELEGALAPDAYWRQQTWKRVAVIAAGPATNVLLAIVLFAGLYMVGPLKATRVVAKVKPDWPAARAGLQPTDRILVVAGHRIVKPSQIPSRIEATKGRAFTILVARSGRRVMIGPLRARDDHGAYHVGFQIKGVPGPGQSPPVAVWSALKAVGYVTADTFRGIAHVVTGRDTNQVSSAVGIVRVSSEAFRQSVEDFLSVLGLISLALALLNLLPVLPLDGGHIVMSLLEGVRGRAFSQGVYMRYAAIGFALFAVLMYLGLHNDLFGGGG